MKKNVSKSKVKKEEKIIKGIRLKALIDPLYEYLVFFNPSKKKDILLKIKKIYLLQLIQKQIL